MNLRSLFAVSAGLVALTLWGCEKNPVTPIPLPPLSAVVVTPDVDTLRVGQTGTFTASAFDTLGALVGGATFHWTSLADSIFTVNSTGRVRGESEGTGLLVVEAGGKRDTARVTIEPSDTGWFTQPSNANGATLHGVFFQPDGTHGCAVGDAGKILYTDDAGATWTLQTSLTAFTLYSVWFTTAQEGWAVGVNGTQDERRELLPRLLRHHRMIQQQPIPQHTEHHIQHELEIHVRPKLPTPDRPLQQ